MTDREKICPYCGKLIVLGGYKGRLQTLLEHHQQSRECLLAQAEILRRLTDTEVRRTKQKQSL